MVFFREIAFTRNLCRYGPRRTTAAQERGDRLGVRRRDNGPYGPWATPPEPGNESTAEAMAAQGSRAADDRPPIGVADQDHGRCGARDGSPERGDRRRSMSPPRTTADTDRRHATGARSTARAWPHRSKSCRRMGRRSMSDRHRGPDQGMPPEAGTRTTARIGPRAADGWAAPASRPIRTRSTPTEPVTGDRRGHGRTASRAADGTAADR